MAVTPKVEETASKLKFLTEPEIMKRIEESVAEKEKEILALKATITDLMDLEKDVQKLLAICEDIEKDAGNFEYYAASFVKGIAKKIRNAIEGEPNDS
jgi:hypothetical protein